MTRMRASTTLRRAVLVLGLVLALTGCVRLPNSGPVVEAGNAGEAGIPVACCYVPNPPQPGESRTEIIQHFLEAMTATPIQTNVARQFLTDAAQPTWDPEQATIVYGDTSRAVNRTRTAVSVTMTDAYRLDSRGVYEGPVPAADSTLRFELEMQNGQWRIAELPDALVVPKAWTDDHYRTVDVYYGDPTGQILVPEPVAVPRGEQFATALMRSLLSGPGPALDGVSHNALPEGLTLGLSVPVDAAGVADVALEGDASQMTTQQAELAAAQIAWTLRQDPTIRSIRLTAGGQALPGLPRDIRPDEGAELDPSDFTSSTAMFALRDGRVVGGPPDAMEPVDGLVGERAYGFTDIALSPDSRQVAGLTAKRTAVLVAATYDAQAKVQEVLSEATNLLTPAWDFADRLWLVDRTRTGAQVQVLTSGQALSLQVPGVTGKDVRSFLVSRDGSRLVAVVRQKRRDVVLVSRLRYNDRGVVRAATPASQLAGPVDNGARFAGLAWQSPTTVAVLISERDLAQVRTLSVDGSPGLLSTASPTLSGDFQWLAGAPEEGAPLVASTPQAYVDLSATSRVPVEANFAPSTLTYTG